MILVYDTETTTFPSSSLPANHPNQARIVQLAWVLLDEKFNERGCFNSLIKIPSDVKISEGARNAHGISEEDCRKYGMPIENALHCFLRYFTTCKNVAHNIQFDNQLVCIEHELIFGKPVERWDVEYEGSGFCECCTMEAMTPICQLPHKSNRRFGSQYKWPTLQEAHCYAFGQPFEGAHDALADVRATARIYKWLMEQKKSNPLGLEQFDTKVA